MLPRLVFLIAFAVLAWLIYQKYRKTAPAQRKALLVKALLWGGGAVLLLAVVTGRLSPLFAALAAAIPIGMRLLNALQLIQGIRGTLRSMGIGEDAFDDEAGTGSSTIRTRYLDMSLDHASGGMDGQVLDGPFSGKQLSQLKLDELLRLLETYRALDRDSAEVLEAYLDRERDPTWRDTDSEAVGAEGGSVLRSGPMSRQEALAILGLPDDADADAVREAHRRLMMRLHPDKGGSDYLASKINAAKAVMLGE